MARRMVKCKNPLSFRRGDENRPYETQMVL